MIRAFANRPDSEHGQALVRLVIAAVLLAYLAGLASGTNAGDELRLSVLILLAETLLGLGIGAYGSVSGNAALLPPAGTPIEVIVQQRLR
mgnify:CR=1 FL=1